ncbi:TIMELESS-interacting protein isoform X2 [Megalops cyprinoides]|uniref:TIMELESS-interacting protein isoform X2 n=1 Tax=Megalops cyprinoides TaxID=118141 RepID=UPI0018651C92|nr:TIMELESS-interacting protein isoform X2 [Megalops cyprinoides]
MLDPVENSLFDIPDYENTEDEAFPPLPPPLSPSHDDGEGDPFANGEDEGEMKLAEAQVAKRRAVKRPQPKLDSQRLISERGLPALRTLFDDVKFKGKGHEAEDLKLLMQKMENWAHRLYPKLQFQDFIDKLESLGNKKEVQTCLKRIRLDMPLTHEDFTSKDGEDEEAPPDFHVPDDPGVFSSPPLAPTTPSQVSLTEEQQRRIELNKQLALERRRGRLKAQLESSQSSAAAGETVGLSSQLPSHMDQDLTNYAENEQGAEASPFLQDSPLSEEGGRGSPVPEMSNGRDDSSD